MKNIPIMATNNKNEPQDFFFWLGEDGKLEPVDKETFKQRQDEWEGERPMKEGTRD